MELQSRYSDMVKRMKKSAIRELLKLMKKPGIISFAGGLPAPDTFPVEELKEITQEVLETNATKALQYGTTEGVDELREELAKNYRLNGMTVTAENITITTSSQQALDFTGRLFLNEGDTVLVGLPSYLGGLQAFGVYGADLIGVKFDEKGMRADLLDETITTLTAENRKPKFVYIIPDFQNPAGITMPKERRLEIIKVAHKHDLIIIEDSPYRELRFEGEPQPTIYELAGGDRVITLGTFSKIFVPGFRIGWVIADPAIIDKYITIKQSADLCTAPFVQYIAAKYMEKGYFRENLKKVIAKYHSKRDVMLKAFDNYMPQGVTWTKPEGGLFLFVTLPEWMDAEDLFKKAIEKQVAFVLGTVFHCDGSGKNTMRINFSYVSEEQNLEGVKRLAATIKEMIDNH
ncbi:PLP-dependent aminotransferase family protein [bacterium]|nr:PLP-dependent aminotransferase family protein [bacterium]